VNSPPSRFADDVWSGLDCRWDQEADAAGEFLAEFLKYARPHRGTKHIQAKTSVKCWLPENGRDHVAFG